MRPARAAESPIAGLVVRTGAEIRGVPGAGVVCPRAGAAADARKSAVKSRLADDSFKPVLAWLGLPVPSGSSTQSSAHPRRQFIFGANISAELYERVAAEFTEAAPAVPLHPRSRPPDSPNEKIPSSSSPARSRVSGCVLELARTENGPDSAANRRPGWRHDCQSRRGYCRSSGRRAAPSVQSRHHT